MTVIDERLSGGFDLSVLDQHVIGVVGGERKDGDTGIGERFRDRRHNSGQREVQRTFAFQDAPSTLTMNFRR